MNYPTKPDLFNMQSVIDYDKLFSVNAGKQKVTGSKKTFIKRTNTNVKVHMNNTKKK